MAFERTIFLKLAAASLVVMLAAGPLTAAVPSSAPLSGTVFTGTDHRPLGHAIVHLGPLGEADDDTRIASVATDAEGAFKFAELEAATYEVAVEYEGGLYLVASPVQVRDGQPLVLNLAIQKVADAASVIPRSRGGSGGLFSTPLGATLAVAGTAIAVGAVIESTTSEDKDPVASQFLTR